MIYARMFTIAMIVLLTLYYTSIVLHCFGLIELTKKEIKLNKACVPFYYWVVSQKKSSSNKNN